MTFKEQRKLLEDLLEHATQVSTQIDDNNLWVNSCLRTIRFLLRAEIGYLTKLVDKAEGRSTGDEAGDYAKFEVVRL